MITATVPQLRGQVNDLNAEGTLQGSFRIILPKKTLPS
jgi:hypothetical protein